MAKLLRVFISSPGDVVPERRRAALVIEKLAKDYARFFEIKPYLWETEPMLASGHFQDAIVQPGDTDVVVLILWARLGTPLPERTQLQEYRGIDGRTPVTGTEWEFESGLAAYKQRGAPDLLAYKKGAPPKAEYKSDADLEELRSQLNRLDAFWRRHFVDQGEFRAAFARFEDLDGFEARLESDLRRLIERRIAALRAEPEKSAPPIWVKGSPFRGLETYRFEHAPIFFGRSEATKTAVEHLVDNAEAGRPFLLLLGASGAGKSSLAQAGIVQALGVRGVVPGVGAWRRAVMRPGGHPGGPFMALAAALSDDEALPEVVNGQDVAALARHLEVASADPSFPVIAALKAREQAARQNGELLSSEETRLILVVDQLEELFTLGELTSDQRAAFILCLKGLMDSGRVFVVATMRSDYWHRAAEVPLLVTLAEGRGRLDLLPATQAEIADMIRRSAEVAGIAFEADFRTEIRLDVALADEASREPGALPLLSFLLDALYSADVQEHHGSTLRYDSMRKLGGLKGAIATRAEAAFTLLPTDAQAALPKVLRALVTVSRSDAEPTARAVSMARFAPGSPERSVVESFLDPSVRLLVADGDGEGARFRLAHEALITHWQRAQRQIAQDRDDLRTRATIEEALADWRQADNNNKRSYLLRDPRLAAAVDLANRWADEFDVETQAFIKMSRRRAKLIQRLVKAAAAVFALTTITASILGVLAYRSERIANSARASAEEQQNFAEKQKKVADAQRSQALITQSQFLADLARQKREKGDASAAILIAMAALSDKFTDSFRPFVPAAEIQLEAAWRGLREQLIFAGHRLGVHNAAFSPDGKRIVSAGADDTVRMWDAENGKQIGAPLHDSSFNEVGAVFSPNGKFIITGDYDKLLRRESETGYPKGQPLAAHTDVVLSAAFRPDGKYIVSASRDKTLRLWDFESGEVIGAPFTGHTGAVHSVAFSPDGARVVSASADKTARLWDVKTGKSIRLFTGHLADVRSAAFSPDGKLIVTASDDKTVRLWDTETGVASGPPLSGHEMAVRHVAFSPDGLTVVSASDDGTIRLWSAKNVKQIGEPIAGHASFVSSVAFSPDGKRIISASADSTLRMWDATPRKPMFARLIGPETFVSTAAFSPDGKKIVTAHDDKLIRLWDVQTREQIGAPLSGHRGLVSSAAFSPDGKRIVSASDDKTVRLWEASTGEPIGLPFSGHEERVNSAAFSPDGKYIASASEDKSVRVWGANTGKPIGVPFTGHEDGVSSAAFSPDSTRIVSSSNKSTRQWSVVTGEQLGSTLPGANSVTFSLDGKRLLFSAYLPQLWNAETGKLIFTIKGAGGDASSAVFSPDGKRIVSASGPTQSYNSASQLVVSAPGAVQIWDAETGQAVSQPLIGIEAGINSVAISRDGRRIITASKDRAVRLWRVFANTEQLLAQAKAEVPRCLKREERVAAFLDPEPPAWCVEMGKWPYQTQDWKDWLKYKRENINPPLPDTPDWKDWVAARKTN